MSGEAIMISTERGAYISESERRSTISETEYEAWKHWPVHWSAIWVGALAAIVIVMLFSLIAAAIGAQMAAHNGQRWVDLKSVSPGALIFAVCGAFFSFVAGGWIAGKIAGILRSEPAMLHGAIVWLVAVPLLAFFSALAPGVMPVVGIRA